MEFTLPLPEKGEEVGMDLVPGQMFARGMMPELARQGCFTYEDTGVGTRINYDAISGCLKELRARWEANYPEDLTGTPSVAPARRGAPGAPPRGRGGQPQGQPVPSDQVPPADLSYFHTWGAEPIGIGKKTCHAVNKVWKDTTWQDVMDNVDIHDDSKGSDGSFVRWLAEGLDNKTPGSREITARAKAVVARLEDSPF